MKRSSISSKILSIFCVFALSLLQTAASWTPDSESTPLKTKALSSSYQPTKANSLESIKPVSSNLNAYISKLPASKDNYNPLNPTVLLEHKKSSWLSPVKVENNRFTLIEGRSHFMKFSNRLSRISVSNPSILDFLTLTSTEILLNAKSNGSVDLIVWDLKGSMASFEINVIRDPGLLDQLLKNIDPKGKFEIFPSKNVFVVRGYTSTVQKQKSIDDAVKSFAPGSISLVKIFAIRQILLQCRFVQVDHNRTKEFGMDLESLREQPGRGTSITRILPSGDNGAAAVTSTDLTYESDLSSSVTMTTSGFLDRNERDTFQHVFVNGDEWLSAFIKAVENDQIGKVIARPNLLAKDGEEANFVIGGEQAMAVVTTSTVQVQYKEFGTKLKFKPEINEDDTISLQIEPEVSEPSDTLGVTVNGSRIKGFTKTTVKTIVELKDGQTLLLGGMIQQKLSTTDIGVPFLRHIPIIGYAFQNTNHVWEETELIIMVSPKIVEPENQPILRKSNDDVLRMATDFLKPAIKVDQHGDAIRYYLTENKRWASPAEITKTNQYISPDQIANKETPIWKKTKVAKVTTEKPVAKSAGSQATSLLTPFATKPVIGVVQPGPKTSTATQLMVKQVNTPTPKIADSAKPTVLKTSLSVKPVKMSTPAATQNKAMNVTPVKALTPTPSTSPTTSTSPVAPAGAAKS